MSSNMNKFTISLPVESKIPPKFETKNFIYDGYSSSK